MDLELTISIRVSEFFIAILLALFWYSVAYLKVHYKKNFVLIVPGTYQIILLMLIIPKIMSA